jgi:hypothetical protein
VSRAATPAATTAADAAFFATCLSFDPALRTEAFLDFDDVFALAAFLVFGVTVARFDDLVFARLAVFFMNGDGRPGGWRRKAGDFVNPYRHGYSY